MKQHNELKAGLFIVISFALAIGIFFGITGSSMFVGPTKMYAVDFDLSEDVGGLKSGSVVRIGGLNLGKVKRVVIIQGEGEAKTRAFFSLPVSYKLKQGAQIALQSGLIGSQVNLNITSLGTGSDLSDKDVIDGSPSPLALAIKGLGQASDEIVPMVRDFRNITVPKVNTAIDKATTTFVTANETAGRFKITADEATELVKHIRSKVDPAFDKYHLVGDNAAAAAANVRDIFGDTKRDFRETIANFNAISTDLKVKLPQIADKVTLALDSLKGTLDNTGKLLTDVQKIADDAGSATVTLRSILASNRSRIDDIIKSVAITSTNLENASAEIRRSPWRLLYKPKPNEVANQNLYDTARQFADGSRKLQDAAATLHDTLNDPNAEPEQVQKLLDELQASFVDYKVVEEKLWDEVKE